MNAWRLRQPIEKPQAIPRAPRGLQGYYETQAEARAGLSADMALLGSLALQSVSSSDSERTAWNIKADQSQYGNVPSVTEFAAVKEAYRPQVEAEL